MIGFFYDSAGLIVKAIVLGVIFGVVYDVFRILRISSSAVTPRGAFFEKIKPRKPLLNVRRPKKTAAVGNIAVFIQDIVFFAICTAAEILFFLRENNGEIRIYCLIFSLSGFIIYLVSLGRITIYFSSVIIFSAKCLLYWSLYIIIIPVKRFLKIIKKVSSTVFAHTVGIVMMKIKRRRSGSLERAIISDAAVCFGLFEEVKDV